MYDIKINAMEKQTAQNKRLLSLDILRGITIAGMILVNNPGSWGDIYAPLRHAAWNGLTPTDLVFPFFMFIMGVSTYFSLRKYNFEFTWKSFAKILRRTVVIFAIGLGIAWFGLFLRGILNDKTFMDAVANFDHIRILGVMPRPGTMLRHRGHNGTAHTSQVAAVGCRGHARCLRRDIAPRQRLRFL